MNFLNFINTARCCETNTRSYPNIMKHAMENESGRDRIIRMYSKNEYGFSPEIQYVIHTGSYMTVMASIYGALKHMLVAKTDFHRRNVASVYESEHRARRSLTDRMTLSGIQGACKYAFKYGSFTTLYLLGTMTVANYRNKVSVWEHAAVAAILGGFTRINFGVKGFIAAGTLGGMLGFVTGGVLTLSMHFAGVTLEDLRHYQHEFHYNRNLNREKKTEEKHPV